MTHRARILLAAFFALCIICAIQAYSNRRMETAITSPAPRAIPGNGPIYLSQNEPPAGRGLSPSDVVCELQRLHQEGAYSQIAGYIDPALREPTINILMAVDTVLVSNAYLRGAAERRYGGPLPSDWDLAVLENNLGPFSARLRIISEEIGADQAVVTLQEGTNIPLVHSRFRLQDDLWLLQPDDVDPRFSIELNRLARALHEIGESIDDGAPLDATYDAFAFRIAPQIARVAGTGPSRRAVASIEASN
jgi:hypothetical protein